MNVIEMRAKRAELWDAAKAFRNSHADDKGMMNAEDAAIYDKMVDDVDRMKKDIDRVEREQAIENEMATPVNKPLVDKIGEQAGRGSKAYKDAFWKVFRNKQVPYEMYNALSVGTDENGGYLVPEEFERTLIEALEKQNIFRSLAHVITTSGDRKIPVVATKGTANWIDEAEAYVESDNTFGSVSLSAYKLATTIKISEELLNDSAFDMAGYISREFARRIGAAEEEAFIAGDGSSKPTGILSSATVGVTAASASIDWDDVIDLFYALKAPYRHNAVFLMNDATARALRKLKTDSGEYLWQPSLTAGTPDTILNRPVYTSEYMPELASGNNAILFGDMSYYWIADRAARSFKRLNELYATNGQVGFISSERVDGKLILSEAVQVLTIS